jgi:hypothetical protein
LKVRDRTTDANQGVINIRACKTQIDARLGSTVEAAIAQAGAALESSLSSVENELYQTKLQAGEDPLNFPIKLNDKIAALHGIIESVDARPTDQTYAVFDELSGKLQVQLSRLAGIVATDVYGFNQLLQARGLAPIACSSFTETTSANGDVSGTVPATLSLALGPAASFGAFTPGVAQDYTAGTTANVISTAGDAALSVADPSSTATGHLVNGAFSLPQPLQATASSPAGVTSGPFAPVGGSAAPTPLLSYAAPVSNDAVAIAFKQPIGATDALRTGSYSKTLTFTLSTTTP